MPEPTGSDLHIDSLLSNISIAYLNEPSSYIADRVFPVVKTTKQSNKFAKYTKYDWLRNEAGPRAPLTPSRGGGFGVDTPGTFFCDEISFHQDIADDDIANADDVFDLRKDAARYVVEKLRIYREADWASKYFATSIWGTDLTGQTASPGSNEFYVWDDYSNSTPISDIEDAKAIVRKATGLLPNTLVVSERVHMALKQHPDIVDRFKYTQAGIMTEELLAKVFEVDNYFKASAIFAASPEGSESTSYILDEYSALLVYAAPAPSRYRPTGGYTFRWIRPKVGGREGERLEATIRRWKMTELAGERVEGSIWEDQKLVCSDCGVFFDDAVACGRTLT